MNEIKSNIITGSVQQYPIICKERPFFINDEGNIAYLSYDKVLLNVWGKAGEYTNEIVKALNKAYQLGYEMDRWEWR